MADATACLNIMEQDVAYRIVGANFLVKPVMSLRSNFRGSNFHGDSIAH